MAAPAIVHRLPIVPVLVLGLAACAPATSVEVPTASTEAASAASGCTIKITSICDGEVRFDLVQQPDGKS